MSSSPNTDVTRNQENSSQTPNPTPCPTTTHHQRTSNGTTSTHRQKISTKVMSTLPRSSSHSSQRKKIAGLRLEATIQGRSLIRMASRCCKLRSLRKTPKLQLALHGFQRVKSRTRGRGSTETSSHTMIVNAKTSRTINLITKELVAIPSSTKWRLATDRTSSSNPTGTR